MHCAALMASQGLKPKIINFLAWLSSVFKVFLNDWLWNKNKYIQGWTATQNKPVASPFKMTCWRVQKCSKGNGKNKVGRVLSCRKVKIAKFLEWCHSGSVQFLWSVHEQLQPCDVIYRHKVFGPAAERTWHTEWNKKTKKQKPKNKPAKQQKRVLFVLFCQSQHLWAITGKDVEITRYKTCFLSDVLIWPSDSCWVVL